MYCLIDSVERNFYRGMVEMTRLACVNSLIQKNVPACNASVIHYKKHVCVHVNVCVFECVHMCVCINTYMCVSRYVLCVCAATLYDIMCSYVVYVHMRVRVRACVQLYDV